MFFAPPQTRPYGKRPQKTKAVLCIAEGAAAQDGTGPLFLPYDGGMFPPGPDEEANEGV